MEENQNVLYPNPEQMQRCGPGYIFRSSLNVDAEVSYTSSLRAEDVPLSLNGTMVECVDGADLQTIGSTNICIIGKSYSPCYYWSVEKNKIL